MMPRRAAILAALALPAFPHMVSISTGEAVLTGNRLSYRLRMPAYETTHLSAGGRSLLDHVRFRSDAAEAARLSGSCFNKIEDESVVCIAEYEFPAPPRMLVAESSLHRITVANHVHLLRARRETREEQAVLDISFPRQEIRFEPPSALETAAKAWGGGLLRGLGGPAQWLLLLALVLASRSRGEFALISGSFAAGQALSCLLIPAIGWKPPPRLVEAAAALAIAYLATEVLLLPAARRRWAVAGTLGLFHGLYFALFVQATGFAPQWVVLGGIMSQTAALLALAVLLRRVSRAAPSLQLVRAGASLLLVTGLLWFCLRLRS